ncbi:MAG: FRG domain-containing protein [Candidatus Dormibacteria bacterium]
MIEHSAEVKGVAEYIGALQELGAKGVRPPFWFRGHVDVDHRLVPSAFRNPNHRTNEAAMIRRFMQDAQSFLVDSPAEKWAWLFLAQHYGVPTRLLDWSESALVALYFACERAPTLAGLPPPDGDVWLLLPTSLNSATNTWTGQHPEDLPMFGITDSLEPYHPFALSVAQRHLLPVAALATRQFRRITAQWGTFTITDQESPLELHEHASDFLRRIRVPAGAKDQIQSELSLLGIEDRVVYPDLHRLGAKVDRMFK